MSACGYIMITIYYRQVGASWAMCFAMTWWPTSPLEWRNLAREIAAMIAEIVLVTIIVTSLIRPLLDRVADASGQPASDVPDKPKLPHPTLLKDSKSSSFSRAQTKTVTLGGDGGLLNRSKSFGRCDAHNNNHIIIMIIIIIGRSHSAGATLMIMII